MNITHSYMNNATETDRTQMCLQLSDARESHTMAEEPTHNGHICLESVVYFLSCYLGREISNSKDSHKIVNLLIFLETIFYILLLLLEMDRGRRGEKRSAKFI